MAKIVYRYPLNVGSPVMVNMPSSAEVIHFGYQADRHNFSIWATVEIGDDVLEQRFFVVVGTGLEIPKLTGTEPSHVGSVVMPDGFHVYHCFECLYVLDGVA